MGESKRRKQLDPNFGKPNPDKVAVQVLNKFLRGVSPTVRSALIQGVQEAMKSSPQSIIFVELCSNSFMGIQVVPPEKQQITFAAFPDLLERLETEPNLTANNQIIVWSDGKDYATFTVFRYN